MTSPTEGSPQVPPAQQPLDGAAVMPPTHGLTVASMGMGIVSLISGLMLIGASLGFGYGSFAVPLFGLCLGLGIAAVVCGHLSLREFSRAASPRSGRGFAIAGLVTGYLGTVIGLAHVAFLVYFFAAFSWD